MVCVSPPIPSVIIISSNLSKQTACIDRSWEQNEACIGHADCRCDVCSGGETEQTLIALSPSPHDHSHECQISTLSMSCSVHTSLIPESVCPANQLDHHIACRRRDAFWCLLCLAVTDKRLYIIATVVDPRYPAALQSLYAPNSGCWRNAPLLLQTQLERMARPRSRRDHQRNVSALTTHSQTHNPYLMPIWTSFSRRLINDNRKNRIFGSENRISEKKRF